MVGLRLTARDREALAEKARHSTDARETRRAVALLDLDAGEPPARVAHRYRVGRSTVYGWAARWRDAGRPRGERLRDADRSGRPPATREAVEAVLTGLMPTAPTGHGYRHPAWTTPLLVAHLRRDGVAASGTTGRRARHTGDDRAVQFIGRCVGVEPDKHGLPIETPRLVERQRGEGERRQGPSVE